MVMVAERQPGKLNSSSLSFLRFPTMTAAESSVKKKLIIKIGPKGVRFEPEEESGEYGAHVLVHHEFTRDTCLKENEKLNMNSKVKLPVQGNSRKRRADTVMDAPKEKRQKMNRGVREQRGGVLKELRKQKTDRGIRQQCDGILVESKLKRGSKNVKQECISNGNGEGAQGKLRTCCRISPSYVSSIRRRTMSLEEKQKLRDELKEMLSGKMTEKFRSTLRKYKLCSLKERIEVDINAFDDEILWELKRMLHSSAKVEPAKMTETGSRPVSSGVVTKGTDCGSRISCDSAKAKAPVSTPDSECAACGHLTCQCTLRNIKGQASSNDMSSERSLKRGGCGVSGTLSIAFPWWQCEVKNLTIVRINRSDPDSNGAGSVVQDNVCLSPGFSACGSTTVSDRGWTPLVDVQLSPKKALRAAMLKSRFADTISKAQKTLLRQGDKADHVKSQQGKVRLEKLQHEEKARIQAQIIAAEAASRMRAEADLKTQRERQTEAARIALEQMERTVEIDDNLKFFKDLEMLSQSSTLDYPFCGLQVVMYAAEGGRVGNPLERLGLYIKEEDDEDAVLYADREEGEILA